MPDLLVDPILDPLAGHQFVENLEDTFPIPVGLLEFGLHAKFVAVAAQKLLDELFGNVNVAAERVCRVAAQKQAVEQGRFTLGRKRVGLGHVYGFLADGFLHKTEVYPALSVCRKAHGCKFSKGPARASVR